MRAVGPELLIDSGVVQLPALAEEDPDQTVVTEAMRAAAEAASRFTSEARCAATLVLPYFDNSQEIAPGLFLSGTCNGGVHFFSQLDTDESGKVEWDMWPNPAFEPNKARSLLTGGEVPTWTVSIP